MRKVTLVIFAAVLVAALATIAAASQLPEMNLSHNTARPVHAAKFKPPAAPFFCPKKTCLFYSGDDDTTNSNNNGLFDFENAGIGITDAQVFNNYTTGSNKKGYTVQGTSGNYFTNTTSIGTNPTPVQFRTGVSAGNAGTQVCTSTTGGTAVNKAYGNNNFGLTSVNYWVKKLNKPCIVKPKKNYWYWLGPQYNDSSTIGYLEDDDGAKANHGGFPGFKEVQNNSFFNSSSFGVTFENTSGSSGACGGIGCAGFSESINGKKN